MATLFYKLTDCPSYHFRNSHAQSFAGTCLKIKIVYNLLKIHFLSFFFFFFFCRNLTHASMGDCFFPMRPLSPFKKLECHLARRQTCIYIQLTCDSGLWFFARGGGYWHVKAYGDVLPKWVTFSPKILRHVSQFGQKSPKRSVPFHKLWEKIVKSAVLEAEKPLEMGLNFQKLQKTVYSVVFLSEKNP